jgi:hypothetical protein
VFFRGEVGLNHEKSLYLRGRYCIYSNFAEFNFSIGSEDPIIADVFTSFSSTSIGHEFMFDYIVDTARRWENNTHETVQFQFDRDNDTEIIEYRYDPLQNVGFSGNSYSAAMIWDFSIHGFGYDRVRFVVQELL